MDPSAQIYARNYAACHSDNARKSLALNAIHHPACPNGAAQSAMGRAGERPTGKLAFSGPGRCSSVTPAGAGRSPRNRPSRKGVSAYGFSDTAGDEPLHGILIPGRVATLGRSGGQVLVLPPARHGVAEDAGHSESG